MTPPPDESAIGGHAKHEPSASTGIGPAGRSSGGGASIPLADFQKVSLRVGMIAQALPHPNADRLLVLQVDVGGEPPQRLQVVAGIKAQYAVDTLVGRSVIVVTNLAPATIRGVESQGMVLAASREQELTLVVPDRPIATGAVVK